MLNHEGFVYTYRAEKNPKLSVIICVYNESHILEACLKAVRTSSFKNYELIVIDDGSKDGSAQIAHSFSDKVFRFEENQGRICNIFLKTGGYYF